jgi:tetratricopeptide (TPR) repeat protein
MSWVGWLFLLAVLYLCLVVVRGVVQCISWFAEEYIIEPRALRRLKEKRPERLSAATRKPISPKHETAGHQRAERKKTSPLPAAPAAPAPRPSRLARMLRSLNIAVAKKSYNHWVSCALSEEDPDVKIAYLSKALAVNPAYVPAWGLKGDALFGLQRYDEAMQCFERSLEIHPSALMWYKKGLCCRHLNRREEAIRCFREALAACPNQDHELWQEAARMKQATEDEVRDNGHG